ncbi:MAG: bifunctional 4-hydroxy-2-oxoglutarate aldolase/2-dehydro-3-deoxy-phosphogluconate aldolase [Cyclobacteriaceae bacterium]|nr:bifunctional 4-hydroxy-2-oxoglutarate aldolase/2-dehydro-3-deoxy-phosphogluconate aldolase [Cyclobacteriaceae bacterium]MDH4297381.1 bifunctional 4-hydroxy-2-oxoglutarate aldolase/2-dehydro-3-deoxy-phosphogluconate aldolase [Cyclobacteriaceae bacterium]MDH5251152.1 bifunctional 4-hydroxy-2-oxoglutarate aldolase/2-dehydro-3-deoxy-phosphogluconate aldolase [Cyclobacteriaceae bacterium]
MRFSKREIVDVMIGAGIVPLFTHDNPDDAQQVLETAYSGGIRVFEFTNRRENSFEVFRHLLSVSRKYPDLMLGIGTIMDGATTRKFIDAGADFIISPILNLEMGGVCRDLDRLWIPGCATLTEIVTARNHGAEIIKLFPASVLGPGFVSAIMPVVPDLRLMITGGVEPTEQSLAAWFNAGAACVGMGSQLFTKEILAKKNWPLLKQKLENALTIAAQVRSK